jgi:hypothetical protein
MKLTPRRLVALLVIFPVLAVMAWLCLNYSASRSRLNRFKTTLSRNGEKFELEAVLPAPVAFDQNGVGIFRRAITALYPSGTYSGVLFTNPPEAMVMVTPGKGAVGWQQKLIRHQATNTWEEVLAELEQDEDGLRQLEQIIDKPAFDFQLNYNQGFNILLPHLSELKRAVQELKSAALCDLHRGDTASAVQRIRASVAMAKAMEEPLIISQLVRYAMANIAVAGTWELLQAPATETELTRLQRDWESLDFYPGAERAAMVERAMLEDVAEQMRNSSTQYRNVVNAFGSGTGSSGGGNWIDQLGHDALLKVHESAWRYGVSYHDQLKALKGHQIVIETIRAVRSGGAFHPALEKEETALANAGFEVKPNTDDNFFLFGSVKPDLLLSQSVLAAHRFPQRLFVTETARQLVIAAIALKRYNIRTGACPRDLQQLVPDFLGRLPMDPADLKPLRYRSGSNTFTLYSIGMDGVDNGGDVTPPPNTFTFPWLKPKDQVWPWPATDTEVDNFLNKRRGHD